MEDDLFKMFQYINMDPTGMMTNLLRSFEQAMWKELRRLASERLKELSSQQKGQKAGVHVGEDMSPFIILGVGFDASEEEVKAAYVKKANKAHPDKGGSNKEMAKLNVAYEVIRRFKGWPK